MTNASDENLSSIASPAPAFENNIENLTRDDASLDTTIFPAEVMQDPTTLPLGEPSAPPQSALHRTIPVLMLLIAAGAIVLTFTLLTVNRRTSEEFGRPSRMRFAITYWLENGFFRSGGLSVRESPTNPLYFHKSSTGGRLIGGFIVEKVYSSVMGRYSWRLLALYNQFAVLVTAAILALLAFRLAVRAGAKPLHALVLAVSLEAVFFTFPDNLALIWGTTGREYWLMFTAIFLLIEERCADGRTLVLSIAQGVSAFLLTYMDYVAGIGLIASYAVAILVLDEDRSRWKRIGVMCMLPVVLAVGLHRAQLAYIERAFPEIPKEGSGFLFRTGFDGSAQYYGDHLDIAYRRDWARNNFPPNQALLFRWKWLFFAGTTALLGILIAALKGRVPRSMVVALVALTGAYLLTAALFSQSVMIHPYLYDVMLLTPLILALFVMAPALIESSTRHTGIVVIAVFFLAVWVSMVHLRRYAVWYPLPPPPAESK